MFWHLSEIYMSMNYTFNDQIEYLFFFFSWLLIEDFFLSIEIKHNTKIYNIHTFYSIN